jgi:endonuclease/exonuclease/phosphatase family metal-dependent hydrolase
MLKIICLILFSVVLPKVSAAPDSLVILSWNVRNYNITDRYIYGNYHFDYPKPEQEKAALRQVVKTLSPDILLLQEVGGDELLYELVMDLESEDSMRYPHYATVTSEDQERKLGIVSAVPFEIIRNDLNGKATFRYFDEDTLVKRGLLEAGVTVGGRDLTIMEMHLKSRITSDKRDPGSEIRREKESRIIRDYIRDLLKDDPDKAILLLGDLNDHPGSDAYRRLTSISGQPLLTEYQLEDESGNMWTYFYRSERRYEQIDYAFLTPILTKEECWSVEGRIVDGDSVDIASDHRPILMTVKAMP